MIDKSVQRRALRGIDLWRASVREIEPVPGGELSVPSCSEAGRSYGVSLARDGRCSCTDWRHRREPCKHLYAATIWVAKLRVAVLNAHLEREAA